jgi:CHASE3 domain sensor protein
MLRQPKYRAVYQFVIGVWLTLSVLSVLLAAVCWLRLSHTLQTGRRWSAIGPQLDGILKTMLDSETSVRGYIITGTTNFLEPYNAAQTNFETQFGQLADLTAGNTNMLQAVVKLRAQSEALADFNRQAIDARNHGFRDAQVLIDAGKGKQIMDQIRAQVSALYQVYYNEILNVRAQIDAQLARSILASLVAGIIGIIAGV